MIYVVKREDFGNDQYFSTREKAEVYISCMGEVDSEAYSLSVEEIELDNWQAKEEYGYRVYCRFTETGEKIIDVQSSNELFNETLIFPWLKKFPSFTGCIVNLNARYLEEAEDKATPIFESYLKTLKDNKQC